MNYQPEKEKINSSLLRQSSAFDATATHPRTPMRRPTSSQMVRHTGAGVVPAMHRFARKNLRSSVAAALLLTSLVCAAPSFVAASELPSTPQTQSESSKAVQPDVEAEASNAAAEKRKALLADATAAIADTERALEALDDNRTAEALTALAEATGKLELVVARDPGLALAPVHVSIVTHDLFADPGTVIAVLGEARKSLAAGDVQVTRKLLAAMASEIEVHTTSIPLATYPAAIKAITPLIDAGKVSEAKAQLQAALATLVITTEVIPLPKVRAERLLGRAQTLVEKQARTDAENAELGKTLSAAREQLELSELLGYGRKLDYKPMHDQLDQIEEKSAGGKSGSGWFDELMKQLSDQFKPLLDSNG